MNIETEVFTKALFNEILPLAQKCWEESTAIKAESCAFYGEREFKIEPNYEVYQGLADNGSLAVVTLRQEEKLVGYVIGFSYKALHHKKITGGLADNLYIEPEFRSYALVLAQRFENEMRLRHVEIIGWPTHQGGPVYNLLKSIGYIGDDIVMEKRLRSN